jgi:hypothetical protein
VNQQEKYLQGKANRSVRIVYCKAKEKLQITADSVGGDNEEEKRH